MLTSWCFISASVSRSPLCGRQAKWESPSSLRLPVPAARHRAVGADLCDPPTSCVGFVSRRKANESQGDPDVTEPEA